MLDQTTLKQFLDYDPGTGQFTWKVSRGGRGRGIGSVAGHVSPIDGYVHIGIKGKVYRAHRLAFLFMTGSIPKVIDHANRLRSDNRWENIRSVTCAQNLVNSRLRCDNSCGLRGVRFVGGNRSKPWQARIHVSGKEISLKYHKTKQEAHKAYARAARKFYGEFYSAEAINSSEYF